MTDSADPRQQIVLLLDAQLQHAGALESLLQAEYQALLTSDLATLADLVARKRTAAESLERCSADLEHCTGGQPQTVIRELGAVPTQRWQQLGELADGLRRQNLHNGALLNERQNRLRWVAQRACKDVPALYAPRTAVNPVAGLSGRTLAHA